MRRKIKRRPWVPSPPPKSRDLETDKFYVSPPWRKIRKAILRDEPACRVCKIYDQIPRVATILDHFRPRRLWPELEMAVSNLMPICDYHHAQKTGLEAKAPTREKWEKIVLPKYKKCDHGNNDN